MLCIRILCAAGGQDASFSWDKVCKADIWVIGERPGIWQVVILHHFVSLDHSGIWASLRTLLDTLGSRCGVCSGFSTLTFVAALPNIMNVVIELQAR